MNNPKDKNIVQPSCKTQLRILGETLLAQIFFTYLAVAICFTSGIHLGPAAFPTALLSGLVLATYGYDFRSSLRILLGSIGCWFGCLLFSSVVMDCSYDGNAYHQEIVAAIVEGWSPGRDEMLTTPLSIWAIHYAKGLEMTAACIVKCTGVLESGKSVNLILGLSAALLVSAFTLRHFPGMRKLPLTLVALMVVLNPVFVSQSISYYIDYAKYFYTLLSILYLIGISSENSRKRDWFYLGALILLAIATKFNAFFEEGVVIFAAMIWLAWRRRSFFAIRIGIFALVCAAFGALVLCHHPYVTNYLDAGHPLFPLMGEGSEDIMTGNTPDVFMGSNRFVTFLKSLFTPAVPSIDTREGGFGPLMPIILLISLVVVWRNRKVGRGLVVYLALWVIGSCFFFEQSWWTRYICQLWILPVAASILVAPRYNSSKLSAVYLWIICVSAFIDASLAFGRTAGAALRQGLYRHAITSELRGESINVSGLNEGYLLQMKERGISAQPCELNDTTPFRLAYYGYTSNPEGFPVMQLDSLQREKILKRLKKYPFDYTINISKTPFE